MGRPKKETYKIDERYIEEALLLAGRYSESVKRRDQLRNLMTGDFEYTKDMAIRDLIGGGVRYDTERVQTVTSPISRNASPSFWTMILSGRKGGGYRKRLGNIRWSLTS